MTEARTYFSATPLQGKSAVVTGAGRGIGAGLAEALLLAGAAVTLVERDAQTLEETARRLAPLGRTCTAQCDVSSREAVRGAVGTAVDAFGTVDVLVNNAQALRPDTPLIDTTETDLQLALDSGLWGTFHMMQECYPYLARRGGAIINFASSAGIVGQAGLGAYAAAKEGIRGLSRVAAREWGPFGITVNLICPAVLTPGAKRFVEEHPDVYQHMLQDRAIPRDGDPVADIGATVVFLASPGATFISGETINVNGGYPLRP